MTVINLRRYYYPLIKTDIFMEVPEEVVEALLQLRREENNRTSKMWYHKAYCSFDCDDGIENDAIGWEQPSPEELIIQTEEEAEHEQLLQHMREVLSFAIYHCTIKIIKRSEERSAVAACRSGQKLTNEWDGQTHDYTHKGGIVHSGLRGKLKSPCPWSLTGRHSLPLSGPTL